MYVCVFIYLTHFYRYLCVSWCKHAEGSWLTGYIDHVDGQSSLSLSFKCNSWIYHGSSLFHWNCHLMGACGCNKHLKSPSQLHGISTVWFSWLINPHPSIEKYNTHWKVEFYSYKWPKMVDLTGRPLTFCHLHPATASVGLRLSGRGRGRRGPCFGQAIGAARGQERVDRTAPGRRSWQHLAAGLVHDGFRWTKGIEF